MGSSFGCRGDICRGASISDVASGWPAASRRARRRALYVRGTQPLPRKCTHHLRHRHCDRTYLGRSWVLEIFCFRGCPSLSSVSRWLLSGFEPACYLADPTRKAQTNQSKPRLAPASGGTLSGRLSRAFRGGRSPGVEVGEGSKALIIVLLD